MPCLVGYGEKAAKAGGKIKTRSPRKRKYYDKMPVSYSTRQSPPVSALDQFPKKHVALGEEESCKPFAVDAVLLDQLKDGIQLLDVMVASCGQEKERIGDSRIRGKSAFRGIYFPKTTGLFTIKRSCISGKKSSIEKIQYEIPKTQIELLRAMVGEYQSRSEREEGSSSSYKFPETENDLCGLEATAGDVLTTPGNTAPDYNQRFSFDYLLDWYQIPDNELLSWLEPGKVNGLDPIDSPREYIFNEYEFGLLCQYHVYLMNDMGDCWKVNPTISRADRDASIAAYLARTSEEDILEAFH